MASGLGDAARPPRRFDLTMSRRTRRPPSLATNRHQEDPALEEGFQQPEQQDQDAKLKEQTPPQCLRLSDHLQSGEDRQEHKTSAHTDECEAQQQQQECEADNSRRFSLQELIEDEAVDGVKDVATGMEESNAVHDGEAAAAAACAEEKRRPEQVPGRRVIRMVRRYAKVRSIKPKPAPEKKLAPVFMLGLSNN